jgi:Protein of unknown function (DUF2815)
VADKEKKENLKRVKTTPFRMSFPALLEPRKNDEGKESFELTMLFPPGEFDKAPYMRAFRAAMTEKYGDDVSKWPKLKRKPDDVLRDFAEYNSNANKPLAGDWSGWTLVRARASTAHPPSVVGPIRGPDGKLPPVTDPRDIYGGRWARATLEAFVFDRKDGRGVTLGIANVQLLKHDTKFGGGGVAVEDDFADEVSPEWSGGADDFDKDNNTAAPAGAAAAQEEPGW